MDPPRLRETYSLPPRHSSLTPLRNSNGIPQITLPIWIDTYDFANRSEILGIGRWGSRTAKPHFTASELGGCLVDVVLQRNAQMAAKARELADVCGGVAGGRVKAAKELAKLVGL